MTNDEDLLAGIKMAMASPAADYMMWAEIEGNGETVEIILETVRIARTLNPEHLAQTLRTQGRQKLIELGFEPPVAAQANIVISLIPEVLPTLDQAVKAMKNGGEEMILLDHLGWEAAKRQTGIKPVAIGTDEEIVYHGLHVRRLASR